MNKKKVKAPITIIDMSLETTILYQFTIILSINSLTEIEPQLQQQTTQQKVRRKNNN